MAISRGQMYRELYMGGGLTPRSQYGLGSIVKSIGKAVKGAVSGIGDAVGSVAKKLEPKDVASLAALAAGQPQLAASFQTAGGGTGNKYLDAGLSLYGGSQGGTFGMPSSTGDYLRLGQTVLSSNNDSKGKEPEPKGIYDVLGRIGSAILEDFADNAIGTLGGGAGATLAYQDQQRINEQLRKAYEDYIRKEQAKRAQYQTGEGLPSLPVYNREITEEDVIRAPVKMGGILNVRTNPMGVQELDMRKEGGFIPPIGIKEKADDIPAMLSNNEFVFTADAVRGAGNGNVEEGAKKMYRMMKMYEGQA